MEIQITNDNSDQYPYIGFQIDAPATTASIDSPPWMPVFFEAASNPTKDRLVRLRDAIADYPFDESVFEELDERLEQIR